MSDGASTRGGEPSRATSENGGWFRGLRVWPAIVILLLGGGAIAYAQLRYPDEPTWRDPYTFVPLMAIAFFLSVWWLFFSGVRWRTRLVVAAVPSAIAVGFLVQYRFDGFSGSVWPQWQARYRWSLSDDFPWVSVAYVPSPGERLDEFVANSGRAPRAGDAESLEVDEADWPGFRGLGRDGVADAETDIRTDWNANPPRELWRHPVGLGWSSFAVVDGLAFTQEQRGPLEVVACYDVETGEPIWVHADETRFSEPQGGDGPRATPTVHEGRVYSLGARGVLNCLDALTGEVHWSTDILKDAGTENVTWGMCGSPLVYDDVVVVNPGLNDGKGEYAVVAYDRLTGETVWTGGESEAGYASPRLETLDGVRQVLIFDAAGLGGYDATTGEELWRFPWKTFSNVNAAQPIVRNERDVFIASGYTGSTKSGCTLLRVTQGDGAWNVAQVYEQPTAFKLKFNGAVYDDGFLYGLDDGMLTCFDYANGTRTWPKTREATFGFGQLILVGEHLIVTHEKDGEVALVKASPDRFQEVSRFRAFAVGEGESPGIAWNHPAYWKGRLLVRNAHEAVCFDLRP